MADCSFPVSWAGTHATVTLPDEVDSTNSSQLRDQLLAVINRGADPLIVDMTATVSCDHGAIDAIVRAYHRAVVNGTQVRLVVTARGVRRVLSIEGVDRLVSVYPTLQAAIVAAPRPTGSVRRGSDIPGALLAGASSRAAGTPASLAAAAITPAILWQLLDALGDGLVLTDDQGLIVLANRRCTELFGYERDELIGRSIDGLLPADLRPSHRGYRASYSRAPVARPMADRARLVGLRKDGASVPVEISLTPVPTGSGHMVLAVVRDATLPGRTQDLAGLAQAAVAQNESRRSRDLLDAVVHNLLEVGLSLQAATDQPGEIARERITGALRRLDDTIHEARNYTF